MTFEFQFDQKAFERSIQKEAEKHVQELAREMTQEFDSLFDNYAGKPVSDIKPALKRSWEKSGGSISEPELTDYAQLISDGTRISFETE